MSEDRPNPDQLLSHLQAQEPNAPRGRLKVFLGMCAGVGKTYAMLLEAHEKMRSGMDVVAGYVETHRRVETQALLKDLEQLPRLEISYRGVQLQEFNLDAALLRKPRLILVDELAHTNAEGSRHSKRWQDVVELLEAGIDVVTTLNVQHIESLNDVIAKITGIIIRETVPDSIIERADEIELVDLPPDDLLQRLKEGKVYLPQQVERAVDHFFKRESLVALRELALRTTAQQVNRQVQMERAVSGTTKTWPTDERLLVCVGPSPLSARVIRTARRMASAMQATWLAVAVESPTLTGPPLDHLRRNLRLAERLGAQVHTLVGEQVADEIVAFAKSNNITKIMIGKPAGPIWREWLRGSVIETVIRNSGDIDVLVVKGEAEGNGSPDAPINLKISTPPYLWVLLVLGVCTAIAKLMSPFFSPVNLTMIYMAGVVFASIRLGIGPAIMASVLSPLLFNFFFTEPYHSFVVRDTQYIFTLIVMLVIGLIISGLTQRVQRQTQALRSRYLRTISLYFMSRQLAGAADRDTLIKISTRHVGDVFQCETVIFEAEPNSQLEPRHAAPSSFAHIPSEQATAHWVFEHQQWAGCHTDTLRSAQALYIPLTTSARKLGVVALRPRQATFTLDPEQRHLLESFIAQLAIALERTLLVQEAQKAQVQAESEQLRSALLSCVSHDLRTPLASITGAASTLLESPQPISEQTRNELLRSISEEGARLNHLVGKLLDMTRLESGSLVLQQDWYPLDEIVGSALERLRDITSHHRIQIELPPDLPLLFVDGVLLGEVFINLLENGVKYTPPGSTITIRSEMLAGMIRIVVEDDGPGLQPGTEEAIFHRFVRAPADHSPTGTGLGLAICKAIVRLHGGQIGAENRPAGGARFWLTLPQRSQPDFMATLDHAEALR
ncbi:MAG: Sensor protein KdpD [Phycisphaerae bacterium]|nr:Sensor protein KdpD [Phycisphaerae bacterium]